MPFMCKTSISSNKYSKNFRGKTFSHQNSYNSIIGCVVNGPGEAAMTDIGITGGGKGNNMLYLSGVQNQKVLTNEIVEKVVAEVEKKASELEK